MPRASKAHNILIPIESLSTWPSDTWPDSGFYSLGHHPASGVVVVNPAGNAIESLSGGGGGGGGASQLTDLSDVSAAAQTANFIMAAGDGATGGDFRSRLLVPADIPSLASSYANTTLSNVAATAVGDDLLPGLHNTYSLGNASFWWSEVFSIAFRTSLFEFVPSSTVETLDASGNLDLSGLTTAQGEVWVAANSGTSDTFAALTGAPTTARFILIRAQAGHTITVTHDGSSIFIPGGGSIVLDDSQFYLAFLRSGAPRIWFIGSGGGSSGADTALSNLIATTINTSLISDTHLTDDLGSASKYWNNLYAGVANVFGIALLDSYSTVILSAGGNGDLNVAGLYGLISISANSGTSDSAVSFSNAPHSGLYLMKAAATHTITIVHDGVNIFTPDGGNVVITADSRLLVFISATDVVYVIGFYDHTHDAADITSGTIIHEQGGLEANVSGFAGIVTINGGATAARTITGTANEIDVAAGGGSGGNPTIGIVDNPTIPGTGAVLVPVGTTAQRPTNAAGKVRWNSTLATLEVANGTGWTDALAGSFATGSYSGDNAATQAITGVGFQPKAVIIFTQTDGIQVGIAHKTDQDSSSAGFGLFTVGYQYEADEIISLDSDGFTVGDGTGATGGNAFNSTGRTYSFMAWG